MKMFNLINIGERAGSGVPDVFRAWEKQGWEEPLIEERYGDAARTRVLLKELAAEGKLAVSGGIKGRMYFMN